MNINKVALLLAGSVGFLAMAADAAVLNPNFNQGTDGLLHWTPSDPSLASSVIADSTAINGAQPIYNPPLTWPYPNADVAPPPGGNLNTTFLQVQTGGAGWVSVSQVVSLSAGQTVSGWAALNGYANPDFIPGDVDSADVYVTSGILNWEPWKLSTSDIPNYPSDTTFSGWMAWAFTAPTTANYDVQFRVSAGVVAAGKFSSYGLFAVPETSGWFAWGFPVLTVGVLAFAGSRRRGAAAKA